MHPIDASGKKIGAVATVTILGQSEGGCNPRIMLQHRLNIKENDEFRGLWELPKGKIYAGEHISIAARRELRDETGLEIMKWIFPNFTDQFLQIGAFSTQVASFQPFYCSQAKGSHYHLALAVLVEVSGIPSKTSEADGHSWFTITEIIRLIQDNLVFPLDVPVLIKWIEGYSSQS